MRFASGAVLAALFLSAGGSGSVSTAVAPAPPNKEAQEVIACAREVASEWRAGNTSYFLKTAAENIPVPRDLFADLGAGENPTWNSVFLHFDNRSGGTGFYL